MITDKGSGRLGLSPVLAFLRRLTAYGRGGGEGGGPRVRMSRSEHRPARNSLHTPQPYSYTPYSCQLQVQVHHHQDQGRTAVVVVMIIAKD